MNLDTKSPVSLYYQIERQIRRMIENGDLKIGQEIPTETELVEMFNVSRITVRKALERLEEDGLIIKQRGKKSVVANDIPYGADNSAGLDDFRRMEDELRQQGLQPKVSVLEHILLVPVESIAALFNISPAEELIRIRRLCVVEDEPIWIESRYFPKSVGEKLDTESLESNSVLSLMQKHGFEVNDVEIQLQAVSANPAQAKLLKLTPNFPLLLHQSVSYDVRRNPLQLTRVHLHSDYYKLKLYAKTQAGIPGLDIINGGYLVKKDKRGERNDH